MTFTVDYSMVHANAVCSIENSMVESKKLKLRREDWVRESLRVLEERGIDGVKIVIIAERMEVTSGSFYWHFKGLPDLLDCILDYWEREQTEAVIDRAKAFAGPPDERILNLMTGVINEDTAVYDHPISVWARRDPAVRVVYERTLRKRFEFARWMFKQAGFSNRQSRTRGRLMVTYLMGESSTNLKSHRNWKSIVQEEFELIAGSGERS